MELRLEIIRRMTLSSLLAVLLVVSVGCRADVDEESPPENRTGFGVSVQAVDGGETTQFRIDVRRCGESEIFESETVPLQPEPLPDFIPPFAEGAAHAFADQFFTLPAGCYRVSAKPRTVAGGPASDCSAPKSKKVHVRDGKTKEVLFISQCKGEERGGLDVLGSINHPPRIDSLVYTPSKFVVCPERVQVCVYASDPDDDPIRAEFEFLSGPKPVSKLTVQPPTMTDGQFKQCAALVPSKGMSRLKVTVWDRLKKDGGLMDVEEILKLQSGDSKESHDDLEFPVYGGADCVPPADVGIPDAAPQTDVGPEPDVPPVVDAAPEPDAPPVVDAAPEPDAPPVDAAPEPDAPPVDAAPRPDVGGDGCTRTRGYWSTHNEFATAPGLMRDWPSPHDENDMICDFTWLTAIALTGEGDVWHRLAPQWIAAKLNVAEGASTPANVAAALSRAETLLTNNCRDIPTADETEAEDLQLLLDDYNNGRIGPGKCDEKEDERGREDDGHKGNGRGNSDRGHGRLDGHDEHVPDFAPGGGVMGDRDGDGVPDFARGNRKGNGEGGRNGRRGGAGDGDDEVGAGGFGAVKAPRGRRRYRRRPRILRT